MRVLKRPPTHPALVRHSRERRESVQNRMIVSLEAIFLATFVMISQNRADEKRQALADHQWQLVQEEEKQNEELLEISRQILDLTKELHALQLRSK